MRTEQPRAPGAGALDGRAIRRRRALPGSRAVVGGLLVGLAAVGLFVAHARATGTQVRYVVARHELLPGERIEPRDLTTAAMQLPEAMARGAAFRRPGDVAGRTVVGRIGSGELVQAGNLSTARPPGNELSFPLDRAYAVDGALEPGERIDVVSTYGTGERAFTEVVVRDALLVSRSGGRGALGDRKDDVVTLRVATRTDALALAHAVRVGQVTLVRADGSDGGRGEETPPTYSPAPVDEPPATAAS